MRLSRRAGRDREAVRSPPGLLLHRVARPSGGVGIRTTVGPEDVADALLRRSCLLIALEGMDALDVGEHDVPVESVSVHGRGVLHNGVNDGFLAHRLGQLPQK